MKIYAYLDTAGNITFLGNETEIQDLTNWVLFDELSDNDPKCYNSNTTYFGTHILDISGLSNYKFLNGITVNCTAEDKQKQKLGREQLIPPSPEDQIKLLKAQVKAQSDRNDFMEDCIAEIGTIVYK